MIAPNNEPTRLTLTRRAGEELRIGDFVVRVSGVHGGRVRLTVEAPRSTKILRGECKPT